MAIGVGALDTTSLQNLDISLCDVGPMGAKRVKINFVTRFLDKKFYLNFR